jgi:hypothetical protein
MKTVKALLLFSLLLAPLTVVQADDLTLLSDGKTVYQIVVPDDLETPALTECLNQTARLAQAAFKAIGADVAVITEPQRDAAKPALLLGNTRFAQANGIDVTKLRDWSYVHRVIGKNIIIVGRDQPARGKSDNARRPDWDRVGTAKAAVDFVREFMGVRFLYPELPGYTPVSGAARIDLLASPAIEFLPMKAMTVPSDLYVQKTPLLRVNTSHPAGGIDARNAFNASLFVKSHQKEWNQVLFPFPGHNAQHLQLAHDGYQEPYANTCFNWDTKAMRNAPSIGPKKLTVTRTAAKLTLDSPEWNDVTSHELTLIPPLYALPRKTTMRLLYDTQALHIRADAELGDDTQFAAHNLDRELMNEEALDVCLAPNPSQPLIYHMTQGPNAESKYDALNVRINDLIDPRFGKDDPTWNGDWKSATRIDAATKRWHVHLVIPFAMLVVDTPAKGIRWKANFGRSHLLPRAIIDRAIWSSALSSMAISDVSTMGEIVFE